MWSDFFQSYIRAICIPKTCLKCCGVTNLLTEHSQHNLILFWNCNDISCPLSPSSDYRYYSQCMFQHTGQELADNLKVCMTAALKNYHDINKRLPERILVYRDGVGDGQVWKSNLGDSLLEALKMACFQNCNCVAGNFRISWRKVLCLSYSTKPVCKGQLYCVPLLWSLVVLVHALNDLVRTVDST